MRRAALATTIPVVMLITGACHTITEELPNKPSPIDVNVPINPVIVIVPVPAPPATQPPSNPTTPNPTTPNPTTPNPAPNPAPNPEPGPGNNHAPVARAACSVYFVECNGQIMPDTRNATSAPVGCRVHLDVTTKDANGSETYGRSGSPEWIFSNPGMLERSGTNGWTPTITAKGPHHQDIYAQHEGVRCNGFGVDFR
jgi:hypothetical protein